MYGVGDFETIKDVSGEMRVWLSDICYNDNEHITFTSIEETFEWLSNNPIDILYYHNFKFDGSYIMYWLYRNNYVYAEEPANPGEYSVLVTDRSQWFTITIIFYNGRQLEIRDSLKKIPMSVKQMAKSYDLPISKGEIDYKLYRPVGYKPTHEELSYIHRDTEIVYRVIKIHNNDGMDKLTIAADSMYELQKMCDYNKYFLPKFWKTHKNIDDFCRLAYCGGISWVNPDIEGKEVHHGYVYDYNSMYPSVMLKYPYPVGYPVRWYDKPPKGYPLWIAHCRVDIQRKPGMIACIRDRQRREWIDEYEGDIYITSIDLEMIKSNYYGECELLDGYAFKQESHIFDDYIMKYGEIKRTTKDKAERQKAKLKLNSPYGKFGTNPVKIHKIPVWSDGILKWRLSEPEIGKTYNVAVAAYITAYARYELVKAANASTGLCYTDTDSLHLAAIGGVCPKFVGLEHSTDFGAWKRESMFVRAKYLRQKTYIEEEPNGHLNIAACGCPDTAKNYITYDNFMIGNSYKGKLIPKQRIGGVELTEGRFTIRAPFDRF